MCCLRNLVLVRQCGAVTMATNAVHAHARPSLISLPALPGPTFIYQHLDMFSRCKWNNISHLLQNFGHQISSNETAAVTHSKHLMATWEFREKRCCFELTVEMSGVFRHFFPPYPKTQNKVVSEVEIWSQTVTRLLQCMAMCPITCFSE